MPAHLSDCTGMLINPKVSPPSVAVRPPIRAGEKSLRKGESVRVCVCAKHTYTHTKTCSRDEKEILLNQLCKKKKTVARTQKLFVL